VGPTGAGKSQLALRLARDFHGEIVNADSRQVYRHLDIGTAKPDKEALSLVPHHLIDIVSPDEDFSLACYLELAYRAIADIQQRGRVPFLVGGSGQYVRALLEGWQIPRVPPDPELRRELEARAREGAAAPLYRELLEVDPQGARQIDGANTRRVVRALELYYRTGSPATPRKKQAPPFRCHLIGLTMPRAELYRRLDRRVDEMIARGLVAEVENLAGMGYHYSLPALSSIGYRQIGQYLGHELSLEEAVRRIKIATHRFVRQQYNWFKLENDRIKWFDIRGRIYPEVLELVSSFTGRKMP